ncbi:MAG: GntP family permease [Gammaproteobacteria bacterium]|nr:GntP family permease [Gammaproteobacteria bacterium]MDH3750251.1 GntP family permease [Gammaproteobacteria bacterium]MDH3805040.1 GntP family permease [Gammaproteobacteria bacterium]
MILVLSLVAMIVFIVASTTIGKLHPFVALLLAAFGYGVFTGMPVDKLLGSINAGFGDTIAYIGIVIVAGSIIGTFLQRSGAAAHLAASVLRLAGPKRIPMTMGLVGYVVSMPVFCDAAYILLSPINRALSFRAGVSAAGGAVALSLGLYATHTMVPPTPGPVAAAGILGADLGLVIVWGMVVSMIALGAGLLFAVRYAAQFELAAAPDTTSETAPAVSSDGHSTLGALLPIFVPILLIVGRSVAQLPTSPLGTGVAVNFFNVAGQPAVALSIGALLALFLPKSFERSMLSERGWFGEAILNSALIILITGAGGAFGRVLQASGIADVVGGGATQLGMGLTLPFVLAAAIKTAQGSSTVAIVTTAGIVAPLLASLGLDSETAKALAVVAIGAGSMVVSHANDSYFWVVTQFSGMSVKQGYQLQSLGTFIQGAAAAIAIVVLGMFLI